MSDALTGFVGVLAGAAVAGSGQLLRTRIDQTTRGRTAARLLWAELMETRAAIDSAIKFKEWLTYDWETPLRAWVEHRVDLARLMDGGDYQTIVGAFLLLRLVARERADHASTPLPPGATAWNFEGPLHNLELANVATDRAVTILRAYGEAGWLRGARPPKLPPLEKPEAPTGDAPETPGA